MNSVSLIGRLTRDPDLKYASGDLAVCSITLAVDRVGKDKQADFVRVKVFGKQAENCDMYLRKGAKAAVEGRIQTGSYQDKNGNKVYTTDVVANRVEFLERAHVGGQPYEKPLPDLSKGSGKQMSMVEMPEDFDQIDEDVPW